MPTSTFPFEEVSSWTIEVKPAHWKQPVQLGMIPAASLLTLGLFILLSTPKIIKTTLYFPTKRP